ncbi:hypothetical protein EsDP_00006091 [Epichloe bromicola]|uniref:Uncharacterized protein n=1 Tax=Epichloe bromicola TaxID=79588 RepID=A0ABQ0CWN2_9HYPO
MHYPVVITALLGAALAQNQNQGDGHACVERCNAAMNSCRTQSGANQSYCSSQYASCLGYNPYQNGGFVTPTACASGGGGPAGPAATMPGGQPDECARKCTDAYNGCRTQPGANQATCRASFATCLGYNPPNDTPASCQGQGSGSGISASPSSMPTTTGAAAVGQEDCVARCNAAMDSCRIQPNSNQSYCSSQYASCLGYNPYQNGGFVTPTACSGSASGVAPTGTVPVVAGGSQLSPAYAAMALGLLALL